MTDTVKSWQARVTARVLGTLPDDPETEQAEEEAARRATRPPAPQWAERLARRARGAEADTTPPAA